MRLHYRFQARYNKVPERKGKASAEPYDALTDSDVIGSAGASPFRGRG